MTVVMVLVAEVVAVVETVLETVEVAVTVAVVAVPHVSHINGQFALNVSATDVDECVQKESPAAA